MFCGNGSVLVCFFPVEFRFTLPCHRNTVILLPSSVFIHTGLLSEGSAHLSLPVSAHCFSKLIAHSDKSCPEGSQVRSWIFILNKIKCGGGGASISGRRKNQMNPDAVFLIFFFFFLVCYVTEEMLYVQILIWGQKCLRFPRTPGWTNLHCTPIKGYSTRLRRSEFTVCRRLITSDYRPLQRSPSGSLRKC